MPLYRLSEKEVYFPNPTLACEDGLLAVGGDLRVERLLLAYSHGIFPWYNPDDEILWWCPHERFVIFPKEIHISRSMKKYMKKHEFIIKLNRDFADTMHRCRIKREFDEGTWISDEMEEAYAALHRAGYAMSVEAFEDGQLAGGLYGVIIGRCFLEKACFRRRRTDQSWRSLDLQRCLPKRNL